MPRYVVRLRTPEDMFKVLERVVQLIFDNNEAINKGHVIVQAVATAAKLLDDEDKRELAKLIDEMENGSNAEIIRRIKKTLVEPSSSADIWAK